MKRLWKIIPPCLSDILGFQEVLSHTDGLGVVDDSSPYKPLRMGRDGMAGGREGMAGGGRGFRGHGEGRPEGGRAFAMEQGGMRHGGRPGGGHGGGREGGKRGVFPNVRLTVSEIQETDVVNGTEEKVMQAFEQGRERFQPQFAMLTCAPCAAMINTDLNEIAENIRAQYDIPACAVALDGQKDYLYGVGCTLEAMGKLLLEKAETIPGTVTLLGCNTIDWPEDAVKAAENWLTDAGFRVLSRWGAQETAANLKGAAAASVNLVVNISGLRLARYMEQEFQIPYVVGAPFGAKQCEDLLKRLKGEDVPTEAAPEGEPEALVIGEQLTAQAIRAALVERGWKSVRVCSFFEMDKQLMRPGDQKLIGEDELRQCLEGGSWKAVFGDSDYRRVTDRELPWVSLPNPANHAPAEFLAPFSMVDGALDRWLDEALKH